MMLFFLCVLSGIALAVSQWFIYFYAPLEASMGIAQKIFYLHLPLAFWAMISFFLVFLASIRYLFNKSAWADNFARSCAEIGVLFSSLVLITGMIWGKLSWGIWWTWDPRLSTTLVMWFIYCAYLLINSFDMSSERKKTIRAVLGIAAFLDVPLVFLSARIFRSIHPAVFASKEGGLETEMLLACVVSIFAFGLLWLSITIIRLRQLNLETRFQHFNLYKLNG